MIADEQVLDTTYIELLYLRQRIAELEQKLDQQMEFVATIYDSVPYVVFVYDVLDNNQLRAVRMNQTGAHITGLPVEHWTGKAPEEIHSPADAAAIRARCMQCIQAGTTIEFEERLSFPSGEIWSQSLYTPIRDATGRIYRVVGTAFDITERKQREEAERKQHEQVIQEQAATLAELSTPLLTISNQVVAMPLIGAVDSRRAQQIMETLLLGISRSKARVAILDITGVLVVDTQVANTLIQLAQAVKLLGAQVVITGVRPDMAQTIVGLGIDLRGMVTRNTLQAGIAYALQL